MLSVAFIAFKQCFADFHSTHAFNSWRLAVQASYIEILKEPNTHKKPATDREPEQAVSWRPKTPDRTAEIDGTIFVLAVRGYHYCTPCFFQKQSEDFSVLFVHYSLFYRFYFCIIVSMFSFVFLLFSFDSFIGKAPDWRHGTGQLSLNVFNK